MTVQTTSSKAGPFLGNGSTLVWNSGFRIDQPADLRVIYTDPDGVDSQLDGTLYTATGFGDDDGVSVTYPISGAPIGATEKITLLRMVSYDQQTSITNQGGFYPQVIERALDRIVYQTQQIAEKLGRAITLSTSSALSGLFLPDPESGKFLRGRTDGAGYENADIAGAGSIGIPVIVADGGTGATTAIAARANLGSTAVGDALYTATDAEGARATLGLGSAAVLSAGTAANNAVQLDGNAKLPAVDGSQLTGVYTGMKNRIINGKMEIAQRGGTWTAPASATYIADRFKFIGLNTTAVLNSNLVVPGVLVPDFQSALRLAVTTANASLATNAQVQIYQAIEGYNISDLIGRDFTLSFWVRSTKTGTHCVSFRSAGTNGTPDLSYVAEYIIAASDIWQMVTITVPGGLPSSGGTWNYTSGVGLYVNWTVAAGSTLQTTPGSWQTGNFIATANQVDATDTVNNQFAITGVQLEAGSVASPFEHRPVGLELALCQRYYEMTYDQGVQPGTVVASGGVQEMVARAADQLTLLTVRYQAAKRARPTVTIYNFNTGAAGTFYDATSGVALPATVTGNGIGSVTIIPSANTVNAHQYLFHIAADAEL